MKLINKILILFSVFDITFSHAISESDKVKMVQGSALDFIWLGAEHMITGYDHILFLIGVLFFLTKLSDIVKFVTGFTLGNSITLIFATLFKITANYYIIDAVIALSVIYKGFENLGGFRKISFRPPNLVLMVFIFGLIHGFGLSTRLQQLPLDENKLIFSILSFNLGVEIGQIIALLIIYSLILLSRFKFINSISKIINFGILIAGIYLFIFQINNYLSHEHHEEPINQSATKDILSNGNDLEHTKMHNEGKNHSHQENEKHHHGKNLHHDHE